MMRRFLLALFALAFASTAQAQNYTATQGTGTTFGSKLVAAVNYPQIVFCDPATPAQCVGVNASGQMAIQAPPTLPLPTGAATSANQTTANTSLASLVAGQVGTGVPGTPNLTTVLSVQGQSGMTPLTTNTSPLGAVGITPVSTASLSANQTLKSGSGNLYSIEVSVDTTLSIAPWWLIGYDATSAPADGAITPKKCYAIPANTTNVSYAWPSPIAFTTGITWGVSTTGCFTKTASTHAFISGDVQ